ncbi:MBL fold metallo-hydrolase [Sporosarcina sp. G11-34]|uniref:MBL fold metallo-hydrolase n=1 Tax=Sporosarcina sp. G11-34 TaxID=2849605 RepID=UPI0022A8FDC2|nr:MBL fold metallo-hydrolase [Sporosarcina sp. G11-34]MCZ2257356.1 pyrroloquinoline quinone biosynthesis protein PqqB [Sporosarcina sp. G11-34]
MSKVIVNVLGTAQDAGIPHPNCFCGHCKKALTDHSFKRLAASLAVVFPEEKQWHLIDASPDFKEQLSTLQMRYGLEGQLMESIFLTHAHIGHYPGLLFLGREAIGAKGITTYAGRKMKTLLENEAPWSLLTEIGNIDVNEMTGGKAVPLGGGVSIRPVEVPHRNEFSETFGFWIEGPNRKLLYIPDIDSWDEWSIDIHGAAKEADICLLDATFHSTKEIEQMGRDYREIPHPVMTETMDRLQDLVGGTEIYFTHFNHTNPAINPSNTFTKQVEERGFYIAEEGMEIEI